VAQQIGVSLTGISADERGEISQVIVRNAKMSLTILGGVKLPHSIYQPIALAKGIAHKKLYRWICL
jgi:hypothetical protein